MTETTFEPLTLERAQQLAAEAVAERGEGFKYTPPKETCLYVHDDGEPGCLVGLVISKWDRSVFEELDERNDTEAEDLPGEWFASSAQRFLQVLQAEQDSGAPWGEALHHAENDIAHTVPDVDEED